MSDQVNSAVGNSMGGNKQSGVNFGVSGNNDVQTMVLAVMKEMSKNNKFIHKSDIYTMVQGKYDFNSFEKAIERL